MAQPDVRTLHFWFRFGAWPTAPGAALGAHGAHARNARSGARRRTRTLRFGSGACVVCGKERGERGERPLGLGCACQSAVHWSCFRGGPSSSGSVAPLARCGVCGLRYAGEFAMRAASEWVRQSREGESRLAASMNLAAELVFAGKYEDAMVELGRLGALGAETTPVSTLVALETARVEMMLGGYASAEASFREIVNALVLLRGDGRSDGRSDGRTLRRAKGLWAESITLNAQYSVTHGADGGKKRARAFDRAYRMLTALASEIASEIASEVSATKARERALRYEAVLNEGRAANTLLARGDEYDALVRFEGAIEDAAWLGDECPLVLSLRHGRALCLARLGGHDGHDGDDVDDAEREMRGVVQAYTTMYSAEHPLAVRALADLASIADA